MTKTNTERTEERKNRFSGESIMLTKEEARRHDCIFLAEVMATLEDRTLGTGMSKHWEEQVRLHPRTECLETPIKDPLKKTTVTEYGYRYTDTKIEVDQTRQS